MANKKAWKQKTKRIEIDDELTLCISPASIFNKRFSVE
jgi:hypothetical protein